jgi:hypothetical protein
MINPLKYLLLKRLVDMNNIDLFLNKYVEDFEIKIHNIQKYNIEIERLL